jgi:hypothetical protein
LKKENENRETMVTAKCKEMLSNFTDNLKGKTKLKKTMRKGKNEKRPSITHMSGTGTNSTTGFLTTDNYKTSKGL